MTALIRILGCLFLVFCSSCLCSDNSTKDETVYSPKGNETWIALEKSLKGFVQRLMKEYLPTVMRMRSEVELSNPCSGSLMQVVFALRGMKLWALKMLDAAAKPTPGILLGTISAIGSYEECVGIESDGRNPFRGKYCTVEFLPTLPEKPEYVPIYNHDTITKNNFPKMPLAKRMESLNSIFYVAKATYGICIPSTCTKNDLEAIVAAATRSLHMQTNVSRCDVKKELEFSQEQITVIVVLATLAGLVIIATTIDIIFQLKSLSGKENKGILRSMVVAFSVDNSIRKLFSSPSIKICSHLHGIHVLSMIWIIVGLTYRIYGIQYLRNAFHLEEENRKVLFETIPSARTAYNTFYFLGGVLTAYFALKNKEEKRFNSLMFVLIRYLRLTALVLFALGFIILSPLFGSGPLWEEAVGSRSETCQKSWWAYILYVSNWRSHENMCTYSFQYASSLFQLHILALFLIIILHRYLKAGVIFLIMLASASIVSIAVLTYEYRLFPTVTKFSEKGFQKLLFEKTSLQPYCHMGPYVVGLFTGYLLIRHLTASVKAVYQIIFWIFATSVCLAVVYYPHYSHRRDEPVVIETTILSSIYRVGWSISLGWIVYACATGRAGFINRFLSSSLFVPLSRLFHLLFFIIEYVTLIRFGQFEQSFVYSHYNIAYDVFGHLLTALLLSLVGYILVDAPLSSIMQVLVDNPSRQKADLKKEVKLDAQKVQLKNIMIHTIDN